MRKQSLLGAAVAAMLITTGAGAQGQDGAQLYVSRACVTCHGQGGDKPIMPTYPKLAGQNADYAYQQMMDIKNGSRTNGQSAAMRAVVQNVTDQEFRAIAEWLGAGAKGGAPAAAGGTPPAAGGSGAPAGGGAAPATK